jgi:hypothetical protein
MVWERLVIIGNRPNNLLILIFYHDGYISLLWQVKRNTVKEIKC